MALDVSGEGVVPVVGDGIFSRHEEGLVDDAVQRGENGLEQEVDQFVDCRPARPL